MGRFLSGVVLTVALLLPKSGNAQVFQFRTPPPDTSAAGADWQINGDPIVVGGLTYYPTRGFRLFDGQVMAQAGMFESIPVYADLTIEPFSELYVPLGSGRMRVYERRRDHELTMTSREAVGTSGVAVPRVASESASTVLPRRVRPQRTSIITAVPRTQGATGVWLEYNGARWYSSGPAVSFSPERFQPAGVYHGFPVYRDVTGNDDAIWVSVVQDGPLAPYRKQ
jgi:hypothetical protein